MAGLAAAIVFGMDDGDVVVIVTLNGEPPADGVAAATRLMDKVTIDGNVVRMAKRRPALPQPDPRSISKRLAAMFPASALDDLRRQNLDLISALDDLQQQKDQLLLLNSELEETNSGVMALTDNCRKSLSRRTEEWSRSTPSWTRSRIGCASPRSPRTGSGPTLVTNCARH
jgi:hypothetical protein